MPGESVAFPTPLAVTLRVMEEIRARQLRPVATYRLQLHAQFTLRDAAGIVPYLAELGISHVYCSPYLRARVGSTHGYDLCNHNQFNPELGGEPAYREFVAALSEHGLGHILDMVPNHMAASTQNPWWYDVLENGPNSPYAHCFDIDWRPIKPELADKLLLPILGKQYGEVLEARELRIVFQDGAFLLRYYDNELPLSPKSVVPLLTHKLADLRTELGTDHADVIELESIITGLEHLPPQTARDLASVRERQREKEVIKRRLRELAASSPAIQKHIDRALSDYTGPEGDASHIDRLDWLLSEQAYRLSHWRAAFDEINYRRFFDINELAAISMEAPDVFWRSHTLVRSLLAEGSLGGLRIDHIDGLYDPERYLLRLQWAYLADLGQMIFQRLLKEALAATPEPPQTGEVSQPINEQTEWMRAAPEFLRLCCDQVALPTPGPDDLRAILGPDSVLSIPAGEGALSASRIGKPPLYVLTEKILGPDEPLPESWPVAGTTGYDFISTINGLYVAPQGWDEILRNYQRLTGDEATYEQVVHDSKRLVLRLAMASELAMLAHRFNRLSEQHRRSRDLTLNMLRLAAREVLVSFPVYRVYPSKFGISERDRKFVDQAVAKAKWQNKAFDPAVFDFLRDVLLLNHPPGLSPEAIYDREILAGKFQQVTSPVMAKGVEDTSFYVWVPLASVNEVGGDPRRPTTTVQAFHEQSADRTSRYRHAMLASTTHDTKRSEDVRARLNVLSEIPSAWRSAVQKFARFNKRWRREVDGEAAPSLKDEYLFYQSVIGIWPAGPPSAGERRALIQRLQGYMEKAIHEAKQRTSWLNPSRAYDEAVREFVAQTLRDSPQNRFTAEVQSFFNQIAAAGQYNALSQLVLKLLSPGVPDIYQGQELWDYSLVDPDNRRPVNYDLRRWLLGELQSGSQRQPPHGGQPSERLSLHDQRLKLLVSQRLLALRRSRSHLWLEGQYMPIEVTGPLSDQLVAFGWQGLESRRLEVIAVAPRFVQKLIEARRQAGDSSVDCHGLPAETWRGTALTTSGAEGLSARNVLSGQELRLTDTLDAADLLADFPIGVLETSPQ